MKFRKVLDDFEAYGWETPTREIAASVGLKPEQVVRLDTNTSMFRPEAAMSELAKVLPGLHVNDYPDTSYYGLMQGLTRYLGKGPERIVITNGADEGLDIVSKTVLDQGDEVIIPTPTYSMYRIVSQIMGAKVKAVPRREDFSLDVDAILESVGKRTKMIVVCNPNNPSGNFSPVEEIERIVKESGVAVLLDEAYFEICGKTAIDLSDRYENVIVCRTFSKAFSMAGVRVGYLVAKRETVEVLNKVRPPNSLSVISVVLGEAALRNLGEMRRTVRGTISNRKGLLEQLRGLDDLLTAYPSQTNFVLVRIKRASADEVHKRLMKKGLVLRNLSHVKGAENCLRMTVGTPEINARLVTELAKALRN